MKKLLFSICLSVLSNVALHADTVTQWNFQDAGGVGTNAPNIGSGTITHLGGVTHPGFNSGNGSSDPTQPGQGHQTTTYPAQFTASGTAGIQFAVDTTGFEDIICTFDLRTSNTSSRWYQIRYTTDGVNFLDLGSPARLNRTDINGNDIGVGDQWSNVLTADFSSISDVDDNPNFAFQVVSVFSQVDFTEINTSTFYSANTAYECARNRELVFGANSVYAGGTWRFDMVTVSGDSISSGTATVVDQFAFYSIWGGGGSPIDTTKEVFKQTGTPTTLGLDNLINAAQGITGIGFEVAGLANAAGLTASDFVVQGSPLGAFDEVTNPPEGWDNAPVPTVTVVPGATSDQVRLSWSAADSAKNRWLRVTFKATANTGLATDEVYFVGHLLGETTGLAAGGSVFTVAFADITPIRSVVGTVVNAGNIADIDKNGTVAFADISGMRSNVGAQLTNITVP